MALHLGANNDTYLASQILPQVLSDLKDATIAVEATYYLQNLLDSPHSHEPLLSALGGLPFVLKSHIEADLDQWKAHNMTPLFVFDGQSMTGKQEMTLRKVKEAIDRTQQAWRLYEKHMAEGAVKAFGKSGVIQAQDLYRFLQEILVDRGLLFLVAPHSACAQIAYLDRHDTEYINGIMGSFELLLYNINNAVTTQIDFDKEVAYGIMKTDLLKKLNVSEDTFTNSLLMCGTSFLPTFPTLRDIAIVPQQPFTVKDAINMFRTAHKSVISLCATWSETLQNQEPDWEDKYRKSRMAIKHSIVIQDEDGMIVNEYENLTGDNHKYLGLRLADEMYHYLVKGAFGSRVFDWLASFEMLVLPPLAGGESAEYRQLVTRQLVPIHEQIIALYTSRMHRAFQHKNVKMRFWFDDNTTVVINHQSVQPPPGRKVSSWRVTERMYRDQESATASAPGSISFALTALQDEAFAASTLANEPTVYELRSAGEILSNTIWRLLHLRGYVNDQHRLTIWGKALLATIGELNPTHRLEEAAFLAFELLQFDQLNARNAHTEYSGGPDHGTPQQNTYCLLISRCACLLKLRHDAIGYTGPLSKNLLAFKSIISAVRNSDYDLTESIMATMFMFAHADRRRRDWAQLGLSLPFITDVDVGLGIAVKTYLDEQCSPPESVELKAAEKQRYANYPIKFAVDFVGDLEIAFDFFEALRAGVKELGSEVQDQAIWEEASKYLRERR